MATGPVEVLQVSHLSPKGSNNLNPFRGVRTVALALMRKPEAGLRLSHLWLRVGLLATAGPAHTPCLVMSDK